MSALIAIGWFLWLCLSVVLVFHFVGMSSIVNMFPEGRRRWHLPAQLFTLAFFAAAVLCHPF